MRYLCELCAEASIKDATIAQPQQSASFLRRAKKTSAAAWIAVAVMAFFGATFFILMPLSLLLNAAGIIKYDSDNSAPPTRETDSNEAYRRQFSTEQDRLEFEAMMEDKRELLRDAPSGSTRRNDPY